jgi:hypothetical protein
MKQTNGVVRVLAGLSLSFLFAAAVFGAARAITIAIDGIKESAWDGSSGQTPGIQTDTNEADIDDRYDIKEFRWTNDGIGVAPWGHQYFLVETYNNFNSTYPPLEPSLIICIDVDNNTTTGATVIGYCNGMSGVDRRINVSLWSMTVTVFRWTGSAWSVVSTPSGGMRSVAYTDSDSNEIADLPYIEVGIDLQSLGITSSATCLGAMPGAVYYDNGIADPEDSMPESGTFDIGCGTPTTISLQSVVARPADNFVVPLLIGLAVLAAGGVGGLIIALRRRKA